MNNSTLVEVVKVGSAYWIQLNKARIRTAATWQELDPDARQLARANGGTYRRIEPISPHDTNTIQPTSAVRVGTTGDVAVTFDGDTGNNAIVLSALAADLEGRRMRVNRVRATDTTALTIEAIYEERY